MSRRARMVALVLLASAAACGRESSSQQVTGPPTITFAKDTVAVVRGDTLRLEPTVTSADSQALTWRSSDSLIVSVNGAGVVFGRTIGKAEVTASLPGVSASVWVYVRESLSAPSSVTITRLSREFTGDSVDRNALSGDVRVQTAYRMRADTGAFRLRLDSTGICEGPISYGDGGYGCEWITSRFDSATGITTYENGPHQLVAQLLDGAGNLGAQATLSVTLANPDSALLRVATAGTATDSAGTSWGTGDVTLSAVPVLYDSAAVDSARFTLTATPAGADTTVTVVQVDRDAGNGVSATLSASSPPAQGGTRGLKDSAAVAGVALFLSDGRTVSVSAPPFAYDGTGG